jgi:hypothetical protein
MCTDDMGTAHLNQPDPQVLHDFEPRVAFDLEPVDAVTVTTLMDNVTDALMPDQGPAHRPPGLVGRPPASGHDGRRRRPRSAGGRGFSVLVTVSRDGSQHQILFDTGASPDAGTGAGGDRGGQPAGGAGRDGQVGQGMQGGGGDAGGLQSAEHGHAGGGADLAQRVHQPGGHPGAGRLYRRKRG